MRFLTPEEEVLLNQYAQDVVEKGRVYKWFDSLNEVEQQDIIQGLWGFVVQSRSVDNDVSIAAKQAGLRLTHTPVVLLLSKKLPFRNRGYGLCHLKGKELSQAFWLILECFSIAQKRKKAKCVEENNCNHWWHQDLSDPKIVEKILRNIK